MCVESIAEEDEQKKRRAKRSSHTILSRVLGPDCLNEPEGKGGRRGAVKVRVAVSKGKSKEKWYGKIRVIGMYVYISF